MAKTGQTHDGDFTYPCSKTTAVSRHTSIAGAENLSDMHQLGMGAFLRA